MYDVISVAFIVAFFALCVAYTHACDRILGPDEQAAADSTAGRPLGPGRRGGGRVTHVLAASGADNWTAMVLAIGLVVFLVLRPRLSRRGCRCARPSGSSSLALRGAADRQHADHRRRTWRRCTPTAARRAIASSARSSG